MPPIDSIVASIPYTVQTTWGFASSVLGTVVSAILTSLMTIFFAVYFSLDGNSFRDRFLELVPESYRSEIKELLSRIRRMWGSYFRGQFTLGIIIGTAIWFMGSIIGLPGAFAIGVFTGMMEVLPSLGPIIASFPAMTVALVQGSNVFEMSNFNFMILVLVLYTIIQQIEANFLIPKILGNAVELHPIVVMTAVVVGMTTGGVLGALVATPITASCKILVLYIYAKILKQEPFLDSDEPLDRLPDLKKRVKSTQRKLSRVWQHLMKQRKLE
ncbi:MAG: hypothetical protein B6242_08945 [Anaerolineaceae bacterium 4572_78]|nr:MAG: hypothetical protein B6242_08945 [Anaerolineaceae bacterium 4572_78]